MFKAIYHSIKKFGKLENGIFRGNYASEQKLNRNVELKLREKIETILFQNYKREVNLIGHLDIWFLFHKTE
jgi:hypothetical protein